MALKDLVIKEAELVEGLVEKVVIPYCKYTEEGKILPNESFRKLPVKDKILVYLTAKKGLRFIINASAKISATNEELEKILGSKGNTIRPLVKLLRDEGLVVTVKGEHQISDHAAGYIIEKLKLQ